MPRPIIDQDECTNCGSCIEVCPNQVLDLGDRFAEVINEETCDGCASCVEACSFEAISIEED